MSEPVEAPYVGQQVTMVTMFRGYDIGGTVVAVQEGLCTVKLDCQDEPVERVLYYDKRPDVVESSYWQICFPRSC